MKEINSEKKPNFIVRLWNKLTKFCKDTVGELKKVSWTPKTELVKSTKLVIVAVLVICIAIAIVDLAFSQLINGIAGLVG